jgi:ABC-type transporter Mla subunit MlaD
MSDLEDLNRRVTSLEARVDMESGLRASVDRDLAAVMLTLRAQQRSIQALATTQSEHTATLAQVGATLNEHTGILDQHTETLAQHTETLAQHTETLNQHTETLNQHTQMLDQHTGQLSRLETSLATMRRDHGAKLNQIVTMLDRLIDEPDGR